MAFRKLNFYYTLLWPYSYFNDRLIFERSIDNFDEKHPADHPDHITDEKGRRESLYHDNHTGHKWRKKFLLPWWTRIIVHILCNIAIIAAAFFIIVKGVDFGDQLVQKWLASLIVSFFMSIILCQPLQVNNRYIFLSIKPFLFYKFSLFRFR